MEENESKNYNENYSVSDELSFVRYSLSMLFQYISTISNLNYYNATVFNVPPTQYRSYGDGESSNGCWRPNCLDTMALCDIKLGAPFRNLLTYLLTYLLTHRPLSFCFAILRYSQYWTHQFGRKNLLMLTAQVFLFDRERGPAKRGVRREASRLPARHTVTHVAFLPFYALNRLQQS